MHPAAEEVDPGHPQGRHLAPAQAGVREKPHQELVAATRRREILDLVVIEEDRLATLRPGETHSLGRIPRRPAIVNRMIQR